MRICLLFLLLVTFSGCGTLPQDEAARLRIYERRLAGLEFPVTRARLYRTLRPASPAQPADVPGTGLLGGGESYRLDDIFVVEMAVVYQAVAGIEDSLAPESSFRSRMHGILDTAQSIDNFMSRGTPEHPADMIRRARIVRRPSWNTTGVRAGTLRY